jgi:acyl-CoA synthetase (AMP-forming)/AMP-acid ligase II
MRNHCGETLPSILESAAGARPDAPALSWRSERWSYAALASAVRSTAAFLRRNGGRPGLRVALLFRNSPQYVAASYGALAAGCVTVPLNPHERADAMAHQLRHCEAEILLVDTAHPEHTALCVLARELAMRICAIDVEGAEHTPAGFMRRFGESDGRLEMPRPESLATIVYTSGTTGNPKGVMLSHSNLVTNTWAIVEYLALKPSDRGIAVLPFQFAYGGSVLHMHLAAGAELLLEDSFAYPNVVLKRMADTGVTGFSGVPSTYAILLSRCDLSTFDLRRLRYLTQAGGAMPRAHVERLRALVPGAQLFIMYGQTEAAARLSYLPPERLEDKPGSVGIAIPGVELSIQHADGSPAGSNEIGEIVARGSNVMMGYLNDAEATRVALRDGWLHTGDLGHFDDEGFLYIDGRSIEMIKVGAFRISPQEIEDVIAAIPGVAEAAVTAVPDEIMGQAIKAAIVLKEDAKLDVRTVKAYCRRHLAIYKVPRLVVFVPALPYTATGKVRRLQLA